jgi:hypothetical protein
MKTSIKNLFYLSISLIVAMFINSCSGGKTSEQEAVDEQLGKLERIEIPASLKNKPEVVAFIKEMEVLTDEFALVVDKTAIEAKEYKGKNLDELGFAEKIQLTKLSSELSFKSLQMIAKWAEFTDKRFSMQQVLNEDEIKAFDAIFNRFQERMKQIEDKFKAEGLNSSNR